MTVILWQDNYKQVNRQKLSFIKYFINKPTGGYIQAISRNYQRTYTQFTYSLGK